MVGLPEGVEDVDHVGQNVMAKVIWQHARKVHRRLRVPLHGGIVMSRRQRALHHRLIAIHHPIVAGHGARQAQKR